MSEQTVSIANLQPMTFRFGGISNPVFIISIRDGLMYFEGNMDEAAKMFFEHYLKPMCDNYIKTTLADDMAKSTLERS